ncbi:MAG TPA: hypothetical protein DEP87_00720 [Candidatus Pacebacteria bacterium]|nr:hypothetical protein [Candidatus Paceibacterota bacterium]
MPNQPAQNLKQTSQQVLAALSLAGQMALQRPAMEMRQGEVKAAMTESDPWLNLVSEEEYREVINKLIATVHLPAGHLPKTDELYLEQQLTDLLGFPITAELENHRLNHSIGIMGAEQHLKRNPTDDLPNHDAFQEAGMAPNRGAFGWFTENGELTPAAINREKYYFAVQLMYLSNWNVDHDDLKPWYKFRKMVMINPAEELAVVGVIGDAGPALWVQKQFGGSPEVIREGKVWSPKAQGHVLLYFVDDPENQIPLGVVRLDRAVELLVTPSPLLDDLILPTPEVIEPGPTP